MTNGNSDRDVDLTLGQPARGEVAMAEQAEGIGTGQEDESIYDELPDAPPKQGIRLSWIGWLATGIVAFWVIIAFVGPYIAPYHEAAFIDDDLDGIPIDDPTFMVPNEQTWLGTDYLGRDIFSRIIWGARTTIGISFAATSLAYFIGIILGIASAVSGGWFDTIVSRINDAILSFPSIMLGLVYCASTSRFAMFISSCRNVRSCRRRSQGGPGIVGRVGLTMSPLSETKPQRSPLKGKRTRKRVS